jgi:hypothetical protein
VSTRRSTVLIRSFSKDSLDKLSRPAVVASVAALAHLFDVNGEACVAAAAAVAALAIPGALAVAMRPSVAKLTGMAV